MAPSDAAETHVREISGLSAESVKPTPRSSSIPVPFSYAPSDDGTDENLLILFHGLGMHAFTEMVLSTSRFTLDKR